MKTNERRCILVIAIGDRPHWQHCRASVADYARRTSADLVVVDRAELPYELWSSLREIRPHRDSIQAYVQKLWSAGRLLRNYDRVLVLDDSCWVSDEAPNLFDLVPKGRFAAFDERIRPDFHAAAFDDRFLKKRRKVVPVGYYNMGVFLVARRHRALLSTSSLVRHRDLFESHYPTQAYFNYLLTVRRVPAVRLDEAWNWMAVRAYGSPDEKRLLEFGQEQLSACRSAFIVHLTGYFSNRSQLLRQVSGGGTVEAVRAILVVPSVPPRVLTSLEGQVRTPEVPAHGLTQTPLRWVPVELPPVRAGSHRRPEDVHRLARRLRVRALHADFSDEGQPFLTYARAAALPLLVTIRRADLEAPKRLHQTLTEATRLIVPSAAVGVALTSLGAPREKVRVCPPGTDVAGRPRPHAERRGIVFVAGRTDRGGGEKLLSAYSVLPSAVRAEHPLVVAGDGPLPEGLHRWAANLGVRPIWLETPTLARLREVLESVAVFCHPSWGALGADWEEPETVVREAQAHEVPIVAIRDYLPDEIDTEEEPGRLFGPSDPHGLAHVLGRLLSDVSRREELGRLGRQWVTQFRSRAAHAARLERLYDEASASVPRSRVPEG